MQKKQHGVFGLTQSMKRVDASALVEFEKEMAEEAIPGIIKDVEKRRILAAEGRQRQLETPTDDDLESPKS